MKSRIVVIANPVSGRGRGANLPRELHKFGFAAPIWFSSAPGDATNLAREAVAAGFETVVAAGGDGTLGEIVNGVLNSQRETREGDLRVGILPVGTGNDFARTLGIGADLQRAVEGLKAGNSRVVDVGISRIGNDERFWLNVAGAGLDSLVAKRINGWRTHPIWGRIGGKTAYLSAVAREMKEFRAYDLRLILDDEIFETRAVLCAVANAQSYGGGMRVAPDASLDDGLFDVCVIEDVSRSEFLRAFPLVFSGRHTRHPKVRIFRARRVELHSGPSLPVLVDGEVVGTTPARFEIVPRALQILAPAN